MSITRKSFTFGVVEALQAAKIDVFAVETTENSNEFDIIKLANGKYLSLDYGSVKTHGLVRVDLDQSMDSGGDPTLASWSMPPISHGDLAVALSSELGGSLVRDEAWDLAKGVGFQPSYAQPRKTNAPT